MTQHISEAHQMSETVGLVCLDIKKALDAVRRLGWIDKNGIQKSLFALDNYRRNVIKLKSRI